jgi:hypothetical protein
MDSLVYTLGKNGRAAALGFMLGELLLVDNADDAICTVVDG